ncbi:copper chaperone PCu(A)C [Longispora sp. NPDC051575]|uniref:copper chaperone PCu(A)C n=1 Tax=Longispora sp. NPDC051575 TaxID=3154943 RepID=UPI003445C82D
MRPQSTLRRSVRVLVAAGALAATVGLAGCGGTDTPAAKGGTPTGSASVGPVLTVVDPWVKTADSGMSAAFGTLRNDSDSELTVVSAASTVSPMELHEVVMDGGKMAMRPKPGGFVIPARGTHELKPGADHLMLMDLKAPIRAGEQVTVTLMLKDGRTVAFTAPAKPFAGGNETYVPSGSPSPMTHG